MAYTISYHKDGSAETETFESYYDLIRFVARAEMNGFRDEDLISLTLGDDHIDNGIVGLCGYAMTKADEMEAEEQMFEEMLRSVMIL